MSIEPPGAGAATKCGGLTRSCTFFFFLRRLYCTMVYWYGHSHGPWHLSWPSGICVLLESVSLFHLIPLNISDPELILCCFRLHFLMWISQDADMAALCVVDFSTCAKRSRRIKLCRGTAVELRYWTPWRWATTTEVRGHFWKRYAAGGFVHTEHLPCSAMRSVPVCDTMCDSWIFCALSCYFSTVGYAEGQPCLYCDIHHEQVLNSEQNVLCMVTRSCNICTVGAFEVWQSRASPCQAPSKARGAINNLCMWTMVSPPWNCWRPTGCWSRPWWQDVSSNSAIQGLFKTHHQSQRLAFRSTDGIWFSAQLT